MAIQGFNSEGIRQLASDLRSRGEDAPELHRQLFNLLLTASGHMGGKPVTHDPDLESALINGFVPIFGYNAPPGSLSELKDTADEMDRRRAQLDAVNELHDAGYPINEEMVFADEDPPSQEDIDNAVEALRNFGDWDEGWDGNRDEIREVTSMLAGLTDAELDIVISQTSPEDLAEFNRILEDKSDTLWYEWGVPRAERREIVGDMLSRVSPDNIDKLTQAFPWVQPGFESTDVFLDGMNPQTGETANGMHWGAPTDPLIADGVSYEDVNQGRFGDCWYLASLIAITQRDPEFIEEGIRENPNGTVSVRIWDEHGNMQWVTVTADLPLDENGSPVGAYGDGETWPAYYEKAFAQVYAGDEGGAPDDQQGNEEYDRAEQGTYGAIEWDFNEQAPPYLTGNDTEGVDGFDGVVEAYDDGHPVIVSTPSEADNVPQDWSGSYSTRHVYYVKGVDESAGTITLGNPWGSHLDDIVVTEEQFDAYFQNPQRLDLP